MSVLSHEMRTPLNGVIGAVDLLERTELTDLQKKYLGYVSTSLNTLLKHVNDVLVVSKLDSSKVILEKELVNLRDLMSDIVQENSAQVEQSGGRITLTFAPNTPLEVETDPRLLKTIVANLVGNAVKFAAGEKISISVEHVSIGTLAFTIKDSGPGIQSSDFDSVFEPFTVLDASYGRHSEGTGLGLSIVATSVEALDGQIELHSEFGNGCEFRVQIPVDLPEVCSEFTTRDSLKAPPLRNNPEPTKNKERKRCL
nr:HAMP domain-containing sensor histidine kinase [Phaeobacter sp. 11ANDIMAR09]